MEEKNELNDIVLNKGMGSSQANKKKMILAAATLGIILIIVILLMNSMNKSNEQNLPQATIPPKPEIAKKQDNKVEEEPLFEDVEIIDDTEAQEDDLDNIAKKLKEQSAYTATSATSSKPQRTYTKPKRTVAKETKKVQDRGRYYIQVGSFSKFRPNDKFLNNIKRNGYDYIFHKTTINGKPITKVLVGPYTTKAEARKHIPDVRKHIIKGAFIVKL